MEKDWARYVRDTRARLNMNRETFSKFLGVSEVSVISWELSKRKPNEFYRDVLEKLNQRLDNDTSGQLTNQLAGLVGVILGGVGLACGIYKLLSFLYSSTNPTPIKKKKAQGEK